MLFIRLLILCALLGVIVAKKKLSAEEVKARVTDLVQVNFYSYIDKLFQSDLFLPGSSAKQLQATSYSESGFLKQFWYTNADQTPDTTCSNPTYILGYAANVCFQSEKYAFMLRLSTGASDCTGGVVQYFNDRECNQYLGSSSLASGQDACSASTSAAGILQTAFQKYQCSTSVSPDVLSSSVTTGLYPNSKCTSNPYGYISFNAGKCNRLDLGDDDPYYYEYACPSNLPGFDVWTSSMCGGSADVSEPFASTCAQKTDDTDYTVTDDYMPPFINPPPSISSTALPGSVDSTASTNYYCTATAPTQKPVFAPTAFPTLASAALASFSVKQIIYGIDAATFSANTANAEVLLQTIAGTMTGVAPADITDLTVIGSSRRLSASGRSLASSMVTAAYTVSTTSVYSAAQLQAELTTAVTSGAFTTDLNDNAAAAGSNDMAGTSSNGFETDSGKKKGLSDGAIVGIVIGVIAFVILMIALMLYCCGCCSRQQTQYTGGAEMAQAR